MLSMGSADMRLESRYMRSRRPYRRAVGGQGIARHGSREIAAPRLEA